MKNVCLFICLWVSCISIFSKGLDGTYINIYGERIVIDNDMLYLIARERAHSSQWWEKDTLATCIMKRINESILEVNSVDPVLYRTWSIESLYEERGDDSIKVNFIIPYSWNDLDIFVGIMPHYRDYKNHNHEKFVMIPRCKELDFEIGPTKMLVEHRPGISDGRVCFYSYELPIENDNIIIKDGVNRIDIKIPRMDNYFFSRYYVMDEYIYVKGKSLHWKGKVFKRIK